MLFRSIAAGRADLCAIARPHLAHPSWTLAEAAAQGYTQQRWPDAYLSAKAQLERAAQRSAAERAAATATITASATTPAPADIAAASQEDP